MMEKQKSRCEFTGCDCLGDSCRKFGAGDCTWNEAAIEQARLEAEAGSERAARRLERLLDEENSETIINRMLG